MGLMRPALAGLGVGAAYGAVWAGLALATGYEYSLLTAGLGIAVGATVAIGAGKDAGNRTGLIALMATLGTALAARLLVVDRLVAQDRADLGEMVREISDDEAMISIAIAEAQIAAAEGRALAWPAGASWETADEPIDFPPEIWTAAVERWRGFSPEQQEEVRGLIRTSTEDGLAAGRSADVDAAFSGSFDAEAVAALVVACLMGFFCGRMRTGAGAGSLDGQPPHEGASTGDEAEAGDEAGDRQEASGGT